MVLKKIIRKPLTGGYKNEKITLPARATKLIEEYQVI